MIALLLALLVAGYYWARETTLDLITRGEGRLIAEGPVSYTHPEPTRQFAISGAVFWV